MLNKFAEKLEELMIENNLSQNQLSKETGISQPQIARWLGKKTTPNIDSVIILSRFFKCTCDYLLGIEN